MTLKKLRKKYKMWLTLAFVFMVLMFVLIGLQIDGWVEVCMGGNILLLSYGDLCDAPLWRCRVCYNLLDPYVLFHGGTASSAVHLWRMRRRRNADFSEYA